MTKDLRTLAETELAEGIRLINVQEEEKARSHLALAYVAYESLGQGEAVDRREQMEMCDTFMGISGVLRIADRVVAYKEARDKLPIAA